MFSCQWLLPTYICTTRNVSFFGGKTQKNSEVGKQAHISRSNLAIVFRGREVSSLYIRVTQIRESAASRSNNYRQLKGYGTQETRHK